MKIKAMVERYSLTNVLKKHIQNSFHVQLLSLSNQTFCYLIYMFGMNYSLYYYYNYECG